MSPRRDEAGRRRINRRQLLALAGAVGVAGAVPMAVHAQTGRLQSSFPFYPQVAGAYTPEDIGDILNMLVTMERFTVANVTANLLGTTQPGLNALHVPIEQAAAVSALAHVDFLESLGARSLADTFTIGGPPGAAVATSARKELITTIFIGAYLAAAREFGELGQPLLVKYAFQTGAEHAEHRALARAMQALEGISTGMPPPNKAFETDLFVYVRDAYALLNAMGLFGGLSVRLPYPNREAVLAAAGTAGAALVQRSPNNAIRSATLTDLSTLTGEKA